MSVSSRCRGGNSSVTPELRQAGHPGTLIGAGARLCPYTYGSLRDSPSGGRSHRSEVAPDRVGRRCRAAVIAIARPSLVTPAWEYREGLRQPRSRPGTEYKSGENGGRGVDEDELPHVQVNAVGETLMRQELARTAALRQCTREHLDPLAPDGATFHRPGASRAPGRARARTPRYREGRTPLVASATAIAMTSSSIRPCRRLVVELDTDEREHEQEGET